MILLAGQTDLEASLLDPRHTALVERIVARHVVDPLTPDEVGDYVRHCLRAAGAKDDVFSADAVREVARLSRGIPAAIGTLCDRALLAGRQRRVRTLRRHSIEDSWSSVGQMAGGEPAPTSGPRRRPRRAGEPTRARAAAAKRIAPAAPSEGDVTAPAVGPGQRLPVSPEDTAVAPDVAAPAEGPAGPEIGSPPRPAGPAAASRPAEEPRPSAFSRPAAPRPPASAPRPPRVRGRTRARPRSPFRRVARLLVAGLAALFLIVGGYSFYGGAPTTISHPVVSHPPSPADPGLTPGPPAAGPPAPRTPSADTPPGPAAPAVRATAGAVTVSGDARAADTGPTRADPGPGARSAVSRGARPSQGSATDVSGRQPGPAGRSRSADGSPMSRDPGAAARPDEGTTSSRAPRSARTEPDPHDAGGVIDWLLNEYPRKSQ
jgi:hypothetical protein